MTRNSPDVAAILAHIRTEVQARRQDVYADTISAEQNVLEQQLQRCIEQLEITRVVSAHWPLVGTTLPQRALALINKLVRRYLRWYINPIVEQQNRYNDVVARTLRLQVEAYTELYASMLALDRPPDGSRQDADAPPRVPAMADAPLAEQSFHDLQALVEQRGGAEPPAALTDMQIRPLLAQLVAHQDVNAHWPLIGHTPLQRGVALLNRLVRRYLRWLINPIVEQQNAFNAAATATVSALLSIDGEVRFQLAADTARRSGQDLNRA